MARANLALVIPDREAQLALEQEAKKFRNPPRLVTPTPAKEAWVLIAERPEELACYPPHVRWMVVTYGIDG